MITILCSQPPIDDWEAWYPILVWVGIAICLAHSAMFSGSNLALFGLSRLHLEIEAEHGNPDAQTVLALRRDANYLLTTILWGNVAVNTLLALLMDSVLTGVAAFLLSTFGITLVGEILPQAYFSRHALRIGARLSPVLSFYRKLLWIVARPSAALLDMWLGPDGIHYFREAHLRALLERHVYAKEADLEHREGVGALNFLSLDDLPMSREGEPVATDSVIALPSRLDLPIIPEISPTKEDPFVRAVAASGHKWVILTNEDSKPYLALNADAFLRDVFSGVKDLDPYGYCHRPIVIENPEYQIGKLMHQFRVEPKHAEDDVIDQDVALLWTDTDRRIITGADLLGRLLRGIAADSPRGQVGKKGINVATPDQGDSGGENPPTE